MTSREDGHGVGEGARVRGYNSSAGNPGNDTERKEDEVVNKLLCFRANLVGGACPSSLFDLFIYYDLRHPLTRPQTDEGMIKEPKTHLTGGL